MAAKKTSTALLNSLNTRKKPPVEFYKAIGELHNVDENHDRKIDDMSTQEALSFIKSKTEQAAIEEPVIVSEVETKKVVAKQTKVFQKTGSGLLHQRILDAKKAPEDVNSFGLSVKLQSEDYGLYTELKNKLKLDNGLNISANLFLHICIEAFKEKYQAELKTIGVKVQ